MNQENVQMEIAIDPEAKAVLEFMQENVAATRLVSLAETLPQMARLLWNDCPQEPVTALRFELVKTECSQSQQAATV
jgi:hypothetical protein